MFKALEFKNENKDMISIYCDIFQGTVGIPKIEYRITNIGIIPYRKRKEIFLGTNIRDRYEYRGLPFNSVERENYVKSEFLKYVTEEQLKQAIKNAYELLKPNAENVSYLVI